MSCTFEEDLTAYVDRELSPQRHKQVEAHLETCGSCKATQALLQTTIAQLALLPAFEPSVGIRRSVLNRIDEPAGVMDRVRDFLRPAVLVPSFGLAAAGVVAVALSVHHGHHRGHGADLLADPEGIELAENMEVVEDLEVVGVTSAEDLEVVKHLQELEAMP